MTKFYFYADWANVESEYSDEPCIINKPKVIGGFQTNFNDIVVTSGG